MQSKTQKLNSVLHIIFSYLYGAWLILKNFRYRMIAKYRMYREYPKRLRPVALKLVLWVLAGVLFANSLIFIPLALLLIGAVVDDI